MMTGDYRQRIFDTYVSRGSKSRLTFDLPVARRRAAYLRSLFAGWLPADKAAPISDLACGSGAVLFALRSWGYTSISGVDVSAEQVAVARQQLGDCVRQGEVLSFLVENQAAFDLLLGIDIIEHLAKAEVLPFLEACHAALRPGGRLILQTPNASSPFGMGVRYGDFTHEVAFTPESLTWLLGSTGFHDVGSRECGPRALGLGGLVRLLAWRVLRLGALGWNLVETGSAGSGIVTRVFAISGVRP